jgi:hypothetical protein
MEPTRRSEIPLSKVYAAVVCRSSGNIHAFWLNDQSNLFYSKAPAAEFSNPARWLPSTVERCGAAVQCGCRCERRRAPELSIMSKGRIARPVSITCRSLAVGPNGHRP